MKRLNKIRLVNWYHIGDETLPIKGSALFMGDNGSGKSTVLDAIQFALVADLSQIRFNQAANENAERSLQGYTRWMVNSDGSKDSHVYNRGDCSSYVLLEFTEEEANGDAKSFVIGVVVDSYGDGRDPNRLHFILNDGDISQVPVFVNEEKIPFTSGGFSKLMRSRKGFFYSREPGAFRDELMIRLGRLSPDFTKILVKAQAFKPLGKVQQFVMDFLLDPRPLDTRSLQDNLASYKALEQKSKDAEKRIEHLSRLEERNEELERASREIRQFRFLELRSRIGIQDLAIEVKAEEIEGLRLKLNDATEEEGRLVRLQTHLETESESILRALSENNSFNERERVRADIKRTEISLSDIAKELFKVAQAKQELDRIYTEINKVDPAALDLVKGRLSELTFEARKEGLTLSEQLKQYKQEASLAEIRLKDLKKGVRPIPQSARVLKELLQQQLHCRPMFLCELVEVEDPKWQDAVEGYLNTRRFDVILDAKYFPKALAIYESSKKQLGIHGVGLVDTEKVQGARSRACEGSLAEVVISRNANANAYIDYLLGDLIRCDSEQDLRQHSRSITASCMVYQNHAARQTPFDIFSTWYIGSRGQARLMEQTKAEIASLAARFAESASKAEQWRALLNLAMEGERLERVADRKRELEEQSQSFTIEIQRLQEYLSALNDPELDRLESRRSDLKKDLEEISRLKRVSAYELGKIEEGIRVLELAIEEARRLREQEQSALCFEFAEAETDTLESYYQEQLEKRGQPEEICRVYEPQRKNRETKRDNIVQQLTALRSDYNNIFGFSGPCIGSDLSPYMHELAAWRGSHLPEFKERIAHAKELALQQLMEDVVHKLRENLDLVPEQFDQINRALKGFHFGHDQYQFTYRVKSEYEPFEKMIQEAAQYENQPLFETDWRSRFRQGGGLEVLFENLVSGSSNQVENELALYSDYREYYEYDLKITNASGMISYFSRVNKWKSGGETQTPYYIAVIASLYRLYRLPSVTSQTRGGGRGTIGLVILDEAFNKMDEDHLKATLQFTKGLGLQLIMATPKERADFIIPHVESTWLVAKDPISGQGFLQDFHQAFVEQRT